MRTSSPRGNARRYRFLQAPRIAGARTAHAPWPCVPEWRPRAAMRGPVRPAGSRARYRLDPAREYVEQVGLDLTVGKCAAGAHVEGVVGVRQHTQGGQVSQPGDERIEPCTLRKFIARALKKEHGNMDF